MLMAVRRSLCSAMRMAHTGCCDSSAPHNWWERPVATFKVHGLNPREWRKLQISLLRHVLRLRVNFCTCHSAVVLLSRGPCSLGFVYED